MKNILITGKPRVGKTTLIERIVDETQKKTIGMITREIRKNERRTGFAIETLSGFVRILASKDNITSRYRVASYGVNVENINLVVEKLRKEMQEKEYDLIILDEIGKMELYSSEFKSFVLDSLETRKVLGTIMLRDNEFSSKIKNRPDTEIFYLTRENWERVKQNIVKRLA
ncbi:MAG: nucleoside-triphosphatase [Candidatus Heimdallarchaeaceae archaeon]